MKKITIALLFFTAFLQAQIKYERAYIIDLNNIKTECLILNYDWQFNPTDIKYKFSESDSVRKANVNDLKGFGVYGYSDYVSCEVQIDKSPAQIDNLTENKSPLFKTEKLFLKTIVTGKAGLYQYKTQEREWYFYTTTAQQIPQQLIYKEYRIKNSVAQNETYKQQLFTNLNNGSKSEYDANKQKYNISYLIDWINDYNGINTSLLSQAVSKPSRERFNFKIFVGENYFTKMSVDNSRIMVQALIPAEFNHQLGVSAELFLGFNKNSWSFILEPTYENEFFKGAIVNQPASVHIRNENICFPLGFRYSFYLSKNNRLYANYLLNTMLHINNNSYFELYDFNSLMESSKLYYGVNHELGIGVELGRISAEFRFKSHKELLSNYYYWTTNYNVLSFTLGYKLFKYEK